jgi:hypothetical protein
MALWVDGRKRKWIARTSRNASVFIRAAGFGKVYLSPGDEIKSISSDEQEEDSTKEEPISIISIFIARDGRQRDQAAKARPKI